VFEIQDEISNAIATELKVTLISRRFFRFDPESQAKALASFEKALSIDPA
jgi:hypothetical protein